MDRIKVKPEFRKLFLARVQGERGIIEMPALSPLEPKPPLSYWTERLVMCGAISQEIARTLKAQAEQLSYSGSNHSRQKTEIPNE